MYQHKDLLGLRGVSAEEITDILDVADTMKEILRSGNKKTPHLQGKSIVTLFYENSTRTRMSFELASKYMSAASANIAAGASSVKKGETLMDTGRTLDRMGTDIIIIRHPVSGAPHMLAKCVRSAVINAGDGMNEHPTQALLDMLTMRQRFGSLKGLRVAVIGDVMHSRVARSNIIGLCTMGASVTLCAPPTLMPVGIDKMGCTIAETTKKCVSGADVVMGLRIQRERQQAGLFPSVAEYCDNWEITPELMQKANSGAILMHPGPINRGVEVSSDAADSDRSVIDAQVTNGVAVRMVLLYMLTRRELTPFKSEGGNEI